MNSKITIKITDNDIDFNNIKIEGDKLTDEQLLVVFMALDTHFQLKSVSRNRLAQTSNNGTATKPTLAIPPGESDKK